jgi:hypothetical protein
VAVTETSIGLGIVECLDDWQPTIHGNTNRLMVVNRIECKPPAPMILSVSYYLPSPASLFYRPIDPQNLLFLPLNRNGIFCWFWPVSECQ